jgi:hypothetical protein
MPEALTLRPQTTTLPHIQMLIPLTGQFLRSRVRQVRKVIPSLGLRAHLGSVVCKVLRVNLLRARRAQAGSKVSKGRQVSARRARRVCAVCKVKSAQPD